MLPVARTVNTLTDRSGFRTRFHDQQALIPHTVPEQQAWANHAVITRFPKTINKYIEIYAPVTWPLPPENTFTPSLTVIANTLPDACPKALNLSSGVYNVIMNAEKWRKTLLDFSFPPLIGFIDIKHKCTTCNAHVWIQNLVVCQRLKCPIVWLKTRARFNPGWKWLHASLDIL